jgi:hypothetical protein
MKGCVVIQQSCFRVDTRAQINSLAGIFGRSEHKFENIDITGIEVYAPAGRRDGPIVILDPLHLQFNRGEIFRGLQK